MYDMFLNAVKRLFHLHFEGLLFGDSASVNDIRVNGYIIDLITDWMTSLIPISNFVEIYSKYVFYDLANRKFNWWDLILYMRISIIHLVFFPVNVELHLSSMAADNIQCYVILARVALLHYKFCLCLHTMQMI